MGIFSSRIYPFNNIKLECKQENNHIKKKNLHYKCKSQKQIDKLIIEEQNRINERSIRFHNALSRQKSDDNYILRQYFFSNNIKSDDFIHDIDYDDEFETREEYIYKIILQKMMSDIEYRNKKKIKPLD